MNKENDNRQECQFEVWTECNSKCVFCYLSTNNIKTLDEIIELIYIPPVKM